MLARKLGKFANDKKNVTDFHMLFRSVVQRGLLGWSRAEAFPTVGLFHRPIFKFFYHAVLGFATNSSYFRFERSQVVTLVLRASKPAAARSSKGFTGQHVPLDVLRYVTAEYVTCLALSSLTCHNPGIF